MKLQQQVAIPVVRSSVWIALNDPFMLQKCLPGCERFTESGPDSYEFALTAKVGPVKAKFSGEVSLLNIVPETSYTITGGGKGGVAGFGKGSAEVSLSDVGDDTLMTYSVDVSVGGKLAQIGSRLVSGAAKKMADDFFSVFVRELCNDPDMEVEVITTES